MQARGPDEVQPSDIGSGHALCDSGELRDFSPEGQLALAKGRHTAPDSLALIPVPLPEGWESLGRFPNNTMFASIFENWAYYVPIIATVTCRGEERTLGEERQDFLLEASEELQGSCMNLLQAELSA